MRLFYIVAVAMARGDELRGLYIWFWDNYENSFFYRIHFKNRLATRPFSMFT